MYIQNRRMPGTNVYTKSRSERPPPQEPGDGGRKYVSAKTTESLLGIIEDSNNMLFKYNVSGF